MSWIPEWLKTRPRKIDKVDPFSDGDGYFPTSNDYNSATNTYRRHIEIVRPHLQSSKCLIVTGYQDFFSSLSIILREVPDISIREDAKIRIAFGIDTGNARELWGRGKSVTEAVRLHFLSQRGLTVDDDADLTAILAADAIRAGYIDLRVFDPKLARDTLGVKDNCRLHAKLITSDSGAIAGSSNFSRAGLYHSLEFNDFFGESASDPLAQKAVKDRKTTAEKVWEASVDWNAEALELLEALLRPVCPEDAVARVLHEQTSFTPWRMELQEDVVGRRPYAHQADLIYEASSIAYEHGFAFVESPAGSGKTDIGKHLGWTLAKSFEAAVGSDHTGKLPRGGAAVIAPPKVIKNWARNAPRSLTAIANSQLTPSKPKGSNAPAEPEHRIEQFGALIIDESHTLMPAFEDPSKRAAALEFAPASWNVCLSATLLGNKDVDWLTHMHEKRASIFMSPSYLEDMEALFKQETDIARMIEGDAPVEALSASAREALTDMLSPFMAHRQRACVGESANRSNLSAEARYPPFTLHPRPKSLSLTSPQARAVDEILQLTSDLAPGQRLSSVTTSRFGTRTERQHNQVSLHSRNLLNFLRVSSAQALWEMDNGATGQILRKLEIADRMKTGANEPRQGSFFDALDLPPDPIVDSTPKCDKLRAALARQVIQGLDERRYDEALKIQKKHRTVVFLAERIDTLQIFAEELSRRGLAEDMPHINFVSSSDRDSSGGPSTNEARRAVNSVCGRGKRHFKTIKEGAQIEGYFRPGGKNAPEEDASVFLTFRMAEGINLQSADALVLLGVTSNLKELIQGLGRIDRIDSEHPMVHYYLIDIPVGTLASDEKVAQRLANYRALSCREKLARVDEAEGDAQSILESVTEYLKEPRQLRKNNYHDLLSEVRGWVDNDRYDKISSMEINGLWGAELAILDGTEEFTLLHLRGEEGDRIDQGAFAPPRLLKVNASGEVERNQIACARSLRSAYEETIRQGITRTSPDIARISGALTSLSSSIGLLTDWHLRPERTVSLLKSLSVFLSTAGEIEVPPDVVRDPETGRIEDEDLFGALSLRGLEYLSETWARMLDPYWVKSKQAVRDRFARSEVQSYISIIEIKQHLNDDLHRKEEMHKIMKDTLCAAMEAGARSQVARRVSVAFVSPGHASH